MSISFDSLSEALCKGFEAEGRLKETRKTGPTLDGARMTRREIRQESGVGNALASMIEGEILPRLLLAHQFPRHEPFLVGDSRPTRPQPSPEAFARLALTASTRELVNEVRGFIESGTEWDSICIDLLAPAARFLGTLWEEDRCSFADVTLGLGKLHQVLHEVIGRWSPGQAAAPSPKRAFFAPTPGEQHVFGLMMLKEFFEAAGWGATSDLGASNDEIIQAAKSEVLDVIGFTSSCEENLESLEALIRQTRAVSRNSKVIIMVGGRVFNDGLGRAEQIGAHATAPDGRQAADVADTMLRQITCAPHKI